jgi:phospholipid transport system transporter-binding protein
MTAFQIERTGPEMLEARGELSFATAAEALKAGTSLIGPEPQCTIVLAQVTEGDSAGLAVLLEWLAVARQRGVKLRYRDVPERVLAVAHISDVQGLLTDN